MQNPREILRRIFRVPPEHDLEPADSSFVFWHLNTPHAAWECVHPSLGFTTPPSESARRALTLQPCGHVIRIPDGDFRDHIHAMVSLRAGVKVIPPHPGIPPITLEQYANSNCVFTDGSKGPYDFVHYPQEYNSHTAWRGFIPFPDSNLEYQVTPELFNPVDFFSFLEFNERNMIKGHWLQPRLDFVFDRLAFTEAEFVRVLKEVGDPTGSSLHNHYGGHLPFLDNLTVEATYAWRTFKDGRDALGRTLRYIAELWAIMCWLRHLRNRALDPNSTFDVLTSAGVPKFMGVWVGSVGDADDWDFLLASPLPLYGIFNVPLTSPLAQSAVLGWWDGEERYRTDAFSSQLLNFPNARQTNYRGGFCKIWVGGTAATLPRPPIPVTNIPARITELSTPTRLLDITSSIVWSAPFYAYPWLDPTIRRVPPRGPINPNKLDIGRRQINISKYGARPMPPAPAAPPFNHGEVKLSSHPLQALLPPASDRKERHFKECAFACYFWAVPISKNAPERRSHRFHHSLEDNIFLHSEYDWPFVCDVVTVGSSIRDFSNGATLDRNPNAKRIYLRQGPSDEDMENEFFCDEALYGYPDPPALAIGERNPTPAPKTGGRSVPASVSHDYSISALRSDIKRQLSLTHIPTNRPRRSSRSQSPPSRTVRDTVTVPLVLGPRFNSSALLPLGGPALPTPLQTTPVDDQGGIYVRPDLRTLEPASDPILLELAARHGDFVSTPDDKERDEDVTMADINEDVTMMEKPQDVVMGERDAEASRLSKDGIQAIQSTYSQSQDPITIGLLVPTQTSASPSVPRDPVSFDAHPLLPTIQSTMSALPPSSPPASPPPPPSLPTPPTASLVAITPPATQAHNLAGMFAAHQAGCDYVDYCLNRSLAPAGVVKTALVRAKFRQKGCHLSFWPLRFSGVNVQESAFDKVRDIFLHLAEVDDWGEIVIVSATAEADETMTVDVGFRFSDDALAMWSRDGLTVLGRHWNITPISKISGKCYITQAGEPSHRTTSARLQRMEVCEEVQRGLEGLFPNVNADVLRIPPTPLLQIQMARSEILSLLKSQPRLDPQQEHPVFTAQALSGNTITEHIELHSNTDELSQHFGIFKPFYLPSSDYLEEDHGLLDFHVGVFDPPLPASKYGHGRSHGSRPKYVQQPVPQNLSEERDMLLGELNWGRRTSRKRAEMNLHAWLVSQPFPPLPKKAPNQSFVDELVGLWKWYDECASDSRSAYIASGLSDLADLTSVPLDPLLPIETRRNRVRQASYLAMEQSFAPSKRLQRVFGSQHREVMAAVNRPHTI